MYLVSDEFCLRFTVSGDRVADYLRHAGPFPSGMPIKIPELFHQAET